MKRLLLSVAIGKDLLLVLMASASCFSDAFLPLLCCGFTLYGGHDHLNFPHLDVRSAC